MNQFVARNGLIAQNNSEVTGSLIVTNGITGSLFGTSSWALNAVTSNTASYILQAVSASYALSSSYAAVANTAFTASYVLNAISSSYATNALSASYALTASYASNVPVTASYAISASQATNANNAVTASYITTAQTASYVLNAVSSSYATSASQATTASYAVSSTSASYANVATSASFATNAISASFTTSASRAISSSYAFNSTSASYSDTSNSASYAFAATSASYALSASWAPGGSGQNTSFPVIQTTHSLSVGNIIKSTGINTYGKAQADSAANAEVVGIVTAVAGPNDFTYTTHGIITTGVPVQAAGTVMFLDPVTAGALTVTEPIIPGQVSKPLVIIFESGAKALFNNFRGVVVASAVNNSISMTAAVQQTSFAVTQVSHGLSVGNIIRSSGANTYTKAQADSASNSQAVGIVTAVSGSSFTYTTHGIIEVGVPAQAAGTVMYLDPSTAGALTTTEPITNGQISKPLVIVLENGSKALFQNFKGSVVGASGGSSFWTTASGTPTRTSNTTFTMTGDFTAIFAKGLIIKWTESSAVRVGMVSIPSTYGAPNTTVTIVGDTMASIDAGSLKYSLTGAEVFMTRFNIVGNISANGTNVSTAYYANEPMHVLGADLQVGTAGITNNTTIDINKNGTTMFTTKPTLATTVSASLTPFTADNNTELALNDKVTVDIDAVQTTPAIDLYTQLYLFPLRYLNLV